MNLLEYKLYNEKLRQYDFTFLKCPEILVNTSYQQALVLVARPAVLADYDNYSLADLNTKKENLKDINYYIIEQEGN